MMIGRARVSVSRRRLAAILAAGLVVMADATSAAAAELVMFERTGCIWCRRWDAEVGVAYPRTPEGAAAPLRRVLISGMSTTEPGLAEPVIYSPTFIVKENGREIGRITGYSGADLFWGMLGKILAKKNAAWSGAGASS